MSTRAEIYIEFVVQGNVVKATAGSDRPAGRAAKLLGRQR
jgi:hypothetical protein